ncbi:MAG: ABC transporter substrate-binding protein [Treponema sp.]
MKNKSIKFFASTLSALLALSAASCSKKMISGGSGKNDGTILVFGAARGEEAARFEEIVKAFNEKTGFNVVYEGSPEFETQIQVQAAAGTPPDIASIPQPGMMKNFAQKSYLKPLSERVVKSIDENYAPVWKELASYNGTVYGVFHRVNAKSFVWYNKPYWEKKGYAIPKTWAELEALEDEMIKNGDMPWSIGFESGAATGWPGTDWLEDMVLRTAGPDVYDKWVSYDIPFDDERIVSALEKCGTIFRNNKYVYGGSTNILTANYGECVRPLFENPPKAMMNRQGNFITGFMQDDVQQNMENLVGVFALPSVDETWGTPVLGGGDQYVKFSDKPGVDEFLEFLSTWEGCVPWAKAGGALFPHKNQNFDNYGNGLEKELAKILVSAKVFRFDASDLMPAEVGSGTFWTGMVNYVSGAESAEECLKKINESWPSN